MTPIHISDPETDQLIRLLAATRSVSLTEAIKVAVSHELQREGVKIMPGKKNVIHQLSGIKILELELDSVIRATTLEYTRILAKKRGTLGVGSRVYQMLARYGAVGTLERLVDRPTTGLEFLNSVDRLDLSAERIALDPKFAPLISDELRARAHANLAKIGSSDD